MLPLSNTIKSDGYCDFSSKKELVGELIGWNDPTDTQNKTLKQLEYLTIRQANNKILLEKIFSDIKLQFQDKPSPSGWTKLALCPFQDHQDKSPSFNYNPEQNRFHCFGCNKQGRAVEFLSFQENKTPYEIALRIVGQKSSLDELTFQTFENNLSKIKAILFNFAGFYRNWVKNHKSLYEINYAEAVNWNLDVYLKKNLSGLNCVNVVELEARIDKITELLNNYKS